MPRYGFTAYDSGGRLERGEVDAESQRAALDTLSRRGLFPLEIGSNDQASRDVRWWNRELLAPRSLPLAAQAMLARELATLLKADIPVDEVLRIIALQPRIGGATRRVVEAVEADVVAGSALSEALAARDGAVPDFFWRLIGAGEASGALAQVLAELADFLEQSLRLRKQLLTALLYPIVLLLAAVLSIGVIVTIMAPALLPLFQDAGAEPPFLLTLLSRLERFLVGSWPITLLFAACLALVGLLATRNERLASLWDRAVLGAPIAGGLVQRGSTARFARTLATLLRNGVAVMDALDAVAGVVRNRAYRSAIRQTREDVNRGQPLLASLSNSGLFPQLALRLVGLGEQTGQLATMLTRVADIYEHDQQQQLERLLAFVTPAVTILIGCLVGFLMITVFGAILGLNEAVLR